MVDEPTTADAPESPSTPPSREGNGNPAIGMWDANSMGAFGCTLNQSRMFGLLAIMLLFYAILQWAGFSNVSANFLMQYWRIMTYGFAAAFAWSAMYGNMERAERNIFLILGVVLAYQATGFGLFSFNFSF